MPGLQQFLGSRSQDSDQHERPRNWVKVGGSLGEIGLLALRARAQPLMPQREHREAVVLAAHGIGHSSGVDIEPAREGRRLARVACEFSSCIFQED